MDSRAITGQPWAAMACLTLALSPLAAAQLDGTVGVSQASGPLRLAPIEGITTAWHDAPTAFAVPVGTRLEFDVEVPDTAVVSWGGLAAANSVDGVCVVNHVGRHKVSVKVVDQGFVTYQSHILVEAFPQYTGGIDVDVQLRSSSMPDGRMTNEDTLDAFFGPPISEVSELEDGHYATSIAKPLSWRAKVEPAGLGALLEWRVDGEAVALGNSLHQKLYEPGSHHISVGPPASAERIQLDIYSVDVTPLFAFAGDFHEDMPLTFLARTEPPGFEHHVTWLASTKHGTAVPATGSGPLFTTTFSATAGVSGSAWVGVKGDHFAMSADGPPPTDPMIQLLSPPTGGDGDVVTIGATNLAPNPELNVCARAGGVLLRINENGPPVLGTLYPVPPSALPGPVEVMNGVGALLPSTNFTGPAYTKVLIDDNTRAWSSDGDEVGTTTVDFTPVPTPGAQEFSVVGGLGGPGLTVEIKMSACADGDCLRLYAFVKTADAAGDCTFAEIEPCAIEVTADMDANDCAIFLCSFLKEAFSGLAGLVCTVTGPLGDTVSITIPSGLGILDWDATVFVGPCGSFPVICDLPAPPTGR